MISLQSLLTIPSARQAAGDFAYRADGIVSKDCSEIIGCDPGMFPYPN